MTQTLDLGTRPPPASDSYDAVVFDIDGVLTVSGYRIPGASETLRRIQRAGVPLAFLTNMTRPRSAVLARLEALGIDVEPACVLSAPAATVAYLQRQLPGEPVLLLASPDLHEDFDGVALTDDPGQARVVVVGGPHEEGPNEYFSYDRLNDAFRAILNGATLVAMHRGLSWQTDRGLALDAGGFVAALEAATGVRAITCGKPSRHFFHSLVGQLGLPASRIIMVGDDVENDIRGASAAGLMPVLVGPGSSARQTSMP